MKIATWNVERLKHERDLDKIVRACEGINADVLVLTEADERILLDYRYCFHTPTPPDLYLPQYTVPLHYESTEHRVSIYTNYECVRLHPTFDEHTALCVELKTERGNLLVYGTIIGILGNREASFQTDLLAQLDDIRRFSAQGHHICILGDYNCSFGDNYYFTKDGRNAILRSFAENQISLVTRKRANCIDHIAISESFLAGADVEIEEWNEQKTLSDHKGISASF